MAPQEDTLKLIAHTIRGLREQYKRSDRRQLDGDNWLTSNETSLLALLVCDICDGLLSENKVETSKTFATEAHPRKEIYTDDTPF